MMKKIAVLLAAVCLTAMLAGCGDIENTWKTLISHTVDIDCSTAEFLDSYQSHEGFHGDGTSFYQLQFPDASAVETIKASDKWHPLPLPDDITAEIYGFEDDYNYYAPSLIKDNDWDNPLMPKVKNGYYLFIDRQSTLNSSDEPIARDYLNYTIAIYDTDKNMLYYGEFDM